MNIFIAEMVKEKKVVPNATMLSFLVNTLDYKIGRHRSSSRIFCKRRLETKTGHKIRKLCYLGSLI